MDAWMHDWHEATENKLPFPGLGYSEREGHKLQRKGNAGEHRGTMIVRWKPFAD